jgi:tetratricopeptide (TPR) repeat protein
LEIARELGERREEGTVQGNLGNAYAALGDVRKAITFYEQWLEIVRELGDRRGEAMGCWNLGLALEQRGDLARAADLMQVCVDYLVEIDHPDAEKRAARLEQLWQRLADSDKSAGGRPGWWRRLMGRG